MNIVPEHPKVKTFWGSEAEVLDSHVNAWVAKTSSRIISASLCQGYSGGLHLTVLYYPGVPNAVDDPKATTTTEVPRGRIP